MHLVATEAQKDTVVLFADVAGSTELYERLGDSAALELVQRCLDVMRRVAHKFSGRVLKTIGDEVMCIFPEPANALYAAAEMQSQVRDLRFGDASSCSLRIGFHIGPVVKHENDAFGATVNIASRITRLAKGGQILASTSLVRELPTPLRLGVRVLNGMGLKARNEDIGLCEISWDFDVDMTVVEQITLTDFGPPPKLRMQMNGQVLQCERSNVTFGRDSASSVKLSGARTSRHHARIEPRRDRFVLIDMSTNGTFLKIDGEPVLRLLREEFVLRGTGLIAFGDTPDAVGVESMTYVLD